jgi:hypothetical protein
MREGPTFQRNLLPPSLGLKSKTNKKPTDTDGRLGYLAVKM